MPTTQAELWLSICADKFNQTAGPWASTGIVDNIWCHRLLAETCISYSYTKERCAKYIFPDGSTILCDKHLTRTTGATNAPNLTEDY